MAACLAEVGPWSEIPAADDVIMLLMNDFIESDGPREKQLQTHTHEVLEPHTYYSNPLLSIILFLA